MRKMIAISVTILVLGLAFVVVISADSATKVVATRGDEVLQPNKFVFADLRFSPGPTVVQSGEYVKWVHADKTDAPHTITLATPDQLVQGFGDFLGGCPACDAAANAALAGHNLFGGPPFVFELDDGDGNFDDPGDSLLFFHGQEVTKQINAPAGTTLYYFCALHPWMQGTIEVK